MDDVSLVQFKPGTLSSRPRATRPGGDGASTPNGAGVGGRYIVAGGQAGGGGDLQRHGAARRRLIGSRAATVRIDGLAARINRVFCLV